MGRRVQAARAGVAGSLYRCIRRECRSPGLAAGGCRDVADRDRRRGIHRPTSTTGTRGGRLLRTLSLVKSQPICPTGKPHKSRPNKSSLRTPFRMMSPRLSIFRMTRNNLHGGGSWHTRVARSTGQIAECVPECLNGLQCLRAQQSFEFGKGLLHWVQVGTVGWQVGRR